MIPLLVVSCDKYADLWPPFFALLAKRWPDCPFPIWLGTNTIRYEHPQVRTALIGEDVSWASGIRNMLEQLGSEHVLVFLEDFLLEAPVDTAAVVRLVDIARRERIGCLRLVAHLPLAFPPSGALAGHPDLGELVKGEVNRVTLQVAVWHVETLMRLLVPGATPWEFEMIGSALSERLPDPFWSVLETVIRYQQVIEKGKWTPSGLRLCADAGVQIDTAARPAFTNEELARHYDRSNEGMATYEHKRRAIRAFKTGDRGRGVRYALRVLRERPAALQMWATGVAGLVGPSWVKWLEAKHVDARVAAIRRRVPE
jgi:hypothetical protein